jgi:hypothetical protein
MNSSLTWQTTPARIVRGHRVASGRNGNPLFPGGTLRMQIPHFAARGFDLTAYHLGTLNVSIAPRRYRVVEAPITFRDMQWHPTEPPEDFSLFDARILRPNHPPVEGRVYHPHPETKPTHFQKPEVLELLFPFIEGLHYGDEIQLSVPAEQMVFEDERTAGPPP